MEWSELEVVPEGKKPQRNLNKESGDGKSVSIKDLNVKQLENIGKQVGQECKQLNNAVSGLKKAGTNFFAARTAVSDWKAAKRLGDTNIVMPFTNVMYVNAKISMDAPLFVELGSGITMEKTEDEAMAFFDRRIQMVTGSMNKVGNELMQKNMATKAIQQEMNDKMKQMNLYNKIYQ